MQSPHPNLVAAAKGPKFMMFHDVSWVSCQNMANTQGRESDMIQFAVDAVDAVDVVDGASLIAQHSL